MAAMQMPIMMLLIFGVFWLLIIRPQAKKQKEHQEMLNKLGKGAVTAKNPHGGQGSAAENGLCA